MTLISLRTLAASIGFGERTAIRWFEAGVIRGTNHGRGRGNGVTLTRDQAIEAAAVMLLRRAGVPLSDIRAIARGLRQAGGKGPAFLALGANGRTALFDGAGDDMPLRDGRGQGVLFAQLDLRRLRGDISQLVDQLEKEAASSGSAAR